MSRGKARPFNVDKFHRFLWKHRNKVDNSVPWTQLHLAEMLGFTFETISKAFKVLRDADCAYRLPNSTTYIVRDPRRYSVEGQKSLPGGTSDV